MKAIYLATSLVGPAQSVLVDLENQRRNFPALGVALEARFGTTRQRQSSIARNCKAEPGELAKHFPSEQKASGGWCKSSAVKHTRMLHLP